MMDENMRKTLARWNFRPVDSSGRVTTDDGQPIVPTPAPQKETDEATRDLAKLVLNTPDVNL